MSSNTMSFALPESMQEYVSTRVQSGDYGNTSEYLRELIRKDQQEQSQRRLRDLIADGMSSGKPREFTQEVRSELRSRALDADE